MMYIPDEEVRDVIEKLDNVKGSRVVLDRLINLLHSNQKSPQRVREAALIKNISNENSALTPSTKKGKSQYLKPHFTIYIFRRITMRLIPIAQLIIAFLPAVTAFADDNPTYKEGLLTIPSVDTAEQVGKYQDVILKPIAEGTWQQLSFKETAVVNTGSGLTFAPIYKVEVITTSSFPTQVFLKLFGSYTDCGDISPIAHQRFANNHFEVVLNKIYQADNPIACSGPNTGFAKTVPLSVYGLKAGTYSYSVASTNPNASGLTGTFNLNADNASVNDSTPDPIPTVACATCKTQP